MPILYLYRYGPLLFNEAIQHVEIMDGIKSRHPLVDGDQQNTEQKGKKKHQKKFRGALDVNPLAS
jgi:hypothetical protein